MAIDVTTFYVPGTVYWAKVLGAPVMNYDGDAREWQIDFLPDDITFLEEVGLTDRLKTDKKGNIPGQYIHLRKKELNAEGEEMPPIPISDADNEPWDQETLIGNGTRVVMKINVKDYGRGKKKGMYIQAIRVEELVSYKRDAFAAYDKNNTPTTTRKAPPKKRPVEELEDDIPF